MAEDTDARWAQRLLMEAGVRHMYGKLTFHFENGKIARVVKEESLKAPEAKK